MKPSEAKVLKNVAQAGLHHTECWRRGPAGESRSGRAALARWRDLEARAVAGADASAASGLRVALMGRVKAGKSTLLNGLVGQTVAGTHAFELTTAIHEVAVRSGPRGPRALLRRADQPDAEMSPLELAELIQANRDAPDFWSSVEHLQTWVEVLEIPERVTLFDTPGVGTMTQANAQRANDFLEAAHVILWVQSATSLGNAEDERFLRELARRGLPLVTVVTRADTLDEDEVEEVLKWFSRRFPDLPAPILTAAPLWQTQDTSAGRVSLLKTLAGFSTGKLEAPGSETLRGDLVDAAEAEQASIARLLTVFEHVERSAELLKRRVLDEVQEHVAEHVERLLRLRSDEIKGELRDRVSKRKEVDTVLADVFSTHLGEHATTAILNEVEREARDRLMVAWGERLGDALQQLNQHLASAVEEIDQRRLAQMTESLAALTQRQSEEQSKARVVAGGLAGAATAYAAWIGANAAAVSIGSAVMSVGLPIFGAGVLAMWAKHAWEKSSARSKAEEEADRLVDGYRERLRVEVLEARFFPALRADVEASGAEVRRLLLDEIAGGAGHAEVSAASRFYDAVASGRLDEAAAGAPSANAMVIA
ncbi:MAG: dynamin family protein [Myxococcales bacterium]|nr:dynamin family protein [Myxococcales bacterium]